MTLTFPAVCPFKTCPCVRSKRPRLCRHHAHMCFNMCAWCRYTRGRFERTYGVVLNGHTGVFPVCHTTHTTHHHTHPPQHHNTRPPHTTTHTTTTPQHAPQHTPPRTPQHTHTNTHTDTNTTTHTTTDTEQQHKATRRGQTDRQTEERQEKARRETGEDKTEDKRTEEKRQDEREQKRYDCGCLVFLFFPRIISNFQNYRLPTPNTIFFPENFCASHAFWSGTLKRRS